MIPQVLGGITPRLDELIAKLKALDVALNVCIEAQGLTQKELTDSQILELEKKLKEKEKEIMTL